MIAQGHFLDAHGFHHDAMNTTFSLRLRGVDEGTARAAARECFEWLDYLESRLSRFIEGSDVSRINHLRAGETLYLSEPCHQCLLLALDGSARTDGLFDITLGTRIEHRKSRDPGPAPPVTGRLTLHPDVPAITCESPGREIDLGGIAKGFALDQLMPLLVGWDAQDSLLAAGASSFLAFGPSAWPVDLTGDRQSLRIFLTNQALSASGTGIQGDHIVHPSGEGAQPAQPLTRVWVMAPSAVMAEIGSTALMLVPPDEIPDWLDRPIGLGEVYAEREGHLSRVPSSAIEVLPGGRPA